MASTYYKLDILERSETGSKGSKVARKNGLVPGVLYYSGEPNVIIAIEKSVLFQAMQSGQRIFEITQSGESQYTMIKEIQYHPVTDEVIHLDLYGVDMKRAVTVSVNIKLIGTMAEIKKKEV